VRFLEGVLPYKEEVGGSSPPSPSLIRRAPPKGGCRVDDPTYVAGWLTPATILPGTAKRDLERTCAVVLGYVGGQPATVDLAFRQKKPNPLDEMTNLSDDADGHDTIPEPDH
jgi:hypothetical protein